MAEKTPGRARKSTSSRKKETTENTSQKSSTVTPIDQAGVGQSGINPSSGRANQTSTLTGSSESSPRSTSTQTSRSGAHPSADQGGVGREKHSGQSPSVLNPSGSIQEGRHAADVRPSGSDLHERIRARAYELFEQRGRHEGFDQEDWARAEAEV